MREYTVILDLINKEVLKCELPDLPLHVRDSMPYENVYNHYRKWYGDAIDQFIK